MSRSRDLREDDYSASSSSSSSTSGFIAVSRKVPGSADIPMLPDLFKSLSAEIFDSISFSPERDSPNHVRFHAKTKALSCASPERLIVQLSSHDILDYDMLSDFFLSFRMFMTPNDLLELIFTRLSWAINFHTQQANRPRSPSNEVGRDVCVRTFVVLRHWVLNFFPDDFLPSFHLRSKFSAIINKLFHWHLVQHNSTFLQIIIQLKKCWLNACSLYWSSQYEFDNFNAELPIPPGGKVGDPLDYTSHSELTDPALRRQALLSLYKDPIHPVPVEQDFTINYGDSPADISTESAVIQQRFSAARISFMPMTGSLIKGGLTMSNDIKIRSIKPLTPIKLANASSTSLNNDTSNPSTQVRKSKSLKTIIDRWKKDANSSNNKIMSKFISKVVSVVDRPHQKPLSLHIEQTPPSDTSQLVRIDVLSARVVEELETILHSRLDYQDEEEDPDKENRTPSSTYSNSINRETEISTGSHGSVIIRSPLDEQYKSDSTPGMLSHDHDSVTPVQKITEIFQDYPQSSTPAAVLAKNNRISLIDSMNLRSKITLSPARRGGKRRMLSGKTPEVDIVTKSGADTSDSDDFDFANTNTNRVSVFSAGSHHSSETSQYKVTDASAPLALRRRANFQDLRGGQQIGPNAYSDISSHSSDFDNSNITDLSSDSIYHDPNVKSGSLDSRNVQEFFSFESQSSSDLIQPYSGVDMEAVAELAAIPDETPEDDAIGAALKKLEGTYTKGGKKPRYTENSAAKNSPHSEKIKALNFSSEDDKENRSGPSVTLFNNRSAEKSTSSLSVMKDFDLANLDPQNDLELYDNALNDHNNTLSVNELDIPSGLVDGSEDLRDQGSPLSAPPNRLLFGQAVTTKAKDKIFQQHDARGDRMSVHTISSVELLSIPHTISNGTHTPFILSYGSLELCQQLTLIERDALAEIDWKELVELRWNKQIEPVQSWLGLLVEKNIRGVEVVISRFNLMVNWIKSEILLTQSLGDRVNTVRRFIHIAQGSREIQNYTTVMQIVLALGSGHITSLRNTWAHIPPEDITILQSLEQLTSPFRNFYHLRVELSSMDFEKGCIPFVGLYLSDLTFNAEKPAFVPVENPIEHNLNSPHVQNHQPLTSGKLVNFDRFRQSASTVKSVIQCIEWSCNYDFMPDYDLLAKCLYINSLTAEEMESCLQYLREP